MKIFDISLTVDENLPTWPGDPAAVRRRVKKIEEGSNANVSELVMGAHTGTHVDAPYHFLPGGSTVESLSLDVLVGPVQVVELPLECNLINGDVVAGADIKPGTERVLFKTRNSTYWNKETPVFKTNFVGISKDGAETLVDMGVKFVGLDYLSIAPYKQSRPTHEVLLGAGMIILEGVDLTGVDPGWYTLYCLPLKLGGADGAPARVILIQE
ncbi:MAG: cyclase family protein [Anaerolineaceae bacterium]